MGEAGCLVLKHLTRADTAVDHSIIVQACNTHGHRLMLQACGSHMLNGNLDEKLVRQNAACCSFKH